MSDTSSVKGFVENCRLAKKVSTTFRTILWSSVRGLWPIINVSNNTGQLSLQFLSLSLSPVINICLVKQRSKCGHRHAATHGHTHMHASRVHNLQNSFEFRVSRLSRASSSPSNICSWRKGDREWLLSNGRIVVERMDVAFPHDAPLLSDPPADSLTADKMRVLRIDTFAHWRDACLRFWQRDSVFRYVRASKPPGIRHNTLPPLAVEHLYNRDVCTDNAIITPVSTVESKKKKKPFLVCHERNQFYIQR